MSSNLLIFLIAIGAVALFVLALSITLLLKGRHMHSDIGDNPAMKKRGIKCAAQQLRDEENSAKRKRMTTGLDPISGIPSDNCNSASCGECKTPDCH